MAERSLRMGVLGLSRGFVLMRPVFLSDPRVRLVAAADPRPEARAAFEAEFAAPSYAHAEALCRDPEVEVVYVATPHGLHAEHAVLAARSGKHVLVEKPMALDLGACRAMTAAARDAGVRLRVGPSHSFDPPVAAAADKIAGGEYGALRMITMLTATDFLYRPRRPEELDTDSGGGVVFSQAAHQVDVAVRLAGARVRAVRAHAFVLDPARPTEGAYQALLSFESGATAALTYSGYGRYDSRGLMDWVGEGGEACDPQAYATARRRLAEVPEPELKRLRAYGAGQAPAPTPVGHENFGFVLASCERADLRLTPRGIELFADTRRTIEVPLPPAPRTAVVDELWSAIVEDRPPLHDAAWGAANLAACLALLRSSREQREVSLAELEGTA